MLLEFQRDFAAALGTTARGPMRVYRNTTMSGCVDALRDNYPVVAQLLGDEMFDSVAANHAEMWPPRNPVLALYGERFPDWLEVQPGLAEIPYIADVARIERLRVESLFARDERPLELSDLRRHGDWEALRLALHPAARFDWLTSPAASIWFSQQEENQRDAEFEWQPEGMLFARPAFATQAILLNPAAHRFLFGIRLGESVGGAAIATATLYPETDIGSLFSSLVNAGAFAATSNRRFT